MNNRVYALFEKAKKNQDINLMKSLYETTDEKVIHFSYAKMLIKNRKYEEAKTILVSLLKKDNNDYFVMLELGKLEKECGNLELARTYFERLLKAKKDNYACFELGKLERECGNLELARTYFERLLNTRSDEYARLELGRLEKECGNIELARSYFKSLLNTRSETYACFELGKLEKENGNIELARTYFESILNTRSDNYGRLELGKLEKESGNLDLARTYFEFLALKKNDVYGRLELAQLEYEEGNVELSKTYFKNLITETNSSHAIILLIVVYIKENNFLEALKLVNSALRNKVGVPKSIILFLSKRLNIYMTDMTQYNYSYRDNQMLDYDEYVAIENIIGRHQFEFSEDVDIYSLFHNISEYLIDENRINKFHLYDNYLIPYPNCGHNGKNHLRVVTLPNSKEIITMFPCDAICDIEEIIDDIEEIKIYTK